MTELHSFLSAKNLDDRVDVLTQEPLSVQVIVKQYPAGDLRSPHLHSTCGIKLQYPGLLGSGPLVPRGIGMLVSVCCSRTGGEL